MITVKCETAHSSFQHKKNRRSACELTSAVDLKPNRPMYR